jgi:hypothetical protein
MNSRFRVNSITPRLGRAISAIETYSPPATLQLCRLC